MRNKIIPISILLALLLPPLALAAPGEANGTVTYVVDGDTINVQIQGCNSRIGNIGVRLADIDCPEMNSSNGTRCKQYTYQELNGSSVTLDLDDKTGKDRFNRWVAVVFLQNPNGTLDNFNKMLVDSGNACIWNFTNNEFDPASWWDEKCPARACKNESSNRSHESDSISCIDNSYNNNSRSWPDGAVVGNIASRKYHDPCCQWAKEMSPANLVWFSSFQDARDQGYLPCQACSPP